MRQKILGVEIDDCTMSSALARINDFVKDGGCHHIVTANPEIVYNALHDEKLRNSINKASLVTADGNGILLAGRILGKPFPERVTGIELAEAICEVSGKYGWKLYFLGAKDGVAKGAVEKMTERYPDIQVVGYHHGYFRDNIEPLLEDLKKTQPDILFVAMGSPYQEDFISRYQEVLGIPVAIGIGGSFDVMSGQVKRAPAFFRKAKLEWAYRIVTDPKRWKRSLTLPKFVFAVLREKRHS